jgi:2'-5' RNA ligase
VTLPQQMTNRWARRPEGPTPGLRTLYWHILVGQDTAVADLANEAGRRLAPFTGLHMTPPGLRHITTLRVCEIGAVTDETLRQITSSAAQSLVRVAPIAVRLGKILYHPEAIMLAVTPADALAPLREAAISSTEAIRRAPISRAVPWTPHITLCYSTSEQPAGPIIEALGTRLPERDTYVQTLSLVIQDGPEREWNWTVVGTVPLTDPALDQRPSRTATT